MLSNPVLAGDKNEAGAENRNTSGDSKPIRDRKEGQEKLEKEEITGSIDSRNQEVKDPGRYPVQMPGVEAGRDVSKNKSKESDRNDKGERRISRN